DGNDLPRVSPAGSTRAGQGPARPSGAPGHRSGDGRRGHGSIPIRQAVQALHRRDALGLSGGSTPLVRVSRASRNKRQTFRNKVLVRQCYGAAACSPSRARLGRRRSVPAIVRRDTLERGGFRRKGKEVRKEDTREETLSDCSTTLETRWNTAHQSGARRRR